MPQSQASALRDVVRATYRRAGLDKSETELQALLPTVRPLIDFDPRQAREADIVGLLGKLSLQDASLPAAPGPVSLIRTLSKEPLAAYGGTTPDITTKSVTELAALLANGTITSREIVLQYMYKIQKLDHAGPALRSVTELNPELLTIADRMDAQRAEAKAKGETLPALFGIPILVKNNIDTADAMRTTASSLALFGSKPADDAALIAQLREQGAIIMGKANMSEWANFRTGFPDISPDGGVALNPLNPVLFASGSSHGSAIAAAMRFAPVTLGTETNGSLMGPATTHHIWALKATPGLVSRTGVIPGFAIVDTPGPMGNTVADLAIVMNAMKGRDAADPLNAAYTGDRTIDFTQKLNGDLTGIRIGTQISDPQIDALLKSLATSANATVVNFTAANQASAAHRAIASLSDADLAVFYTQVTRNTLPADEAASAAILDAYRTNLNGLNGTFAYVDFYGK